MKNSSKTCRKRSVDTQSTISSLRRKAPASGTKLFFFLGENFCYHGSAYIRANPFAVLVALSCLGFIEFLEIVY